MIFMGKGCRSPQEGTTVFKIRVRGNIYVKAQLQQMVVFVTKMKNEDT